MNKVQQEEKEKWSPGYTAAYSLSDLSHQCGSLPSESARGGLVAKAGVRGLHSLSSYTAFRFQLTMPNPTPSRVLQWLPVALNARLIAGDQ